MNKISEHRNKANYSQAAFSKLIGVTTSTIGNYEQEIRTPPLVTCWKIINAFRCIGIECSFEDIFPNSSTDELKE